MANPTSKAKIAVVTRLIPHDYQPLFPPHYINHNEDEVHYWVVSDKPHNMAPWHDLVITPDPAKTSRRVACSRKMQTHKYFSEYDWVIVIDASASLIVDPVAVVNEVKKSGKKLAFTECPWRDCSYHEAMVCLYYGKATPQITYDQLSFYLKEGLPLHFGLAAATFFVRDNKDPEVSAFFDLWLKETEKGCERTQVSFGYTAWKTGLDILYWDIIWGDNRIWRWANLRREG